VRETTSLKHTKIIATLGPASSSDATIRALIRAGADCFRMNFSHGNASSMQPLIDKVRVAAKEEGRHITLLADIQGPKLRIGRLPHAGVLLEEGASFMVTAREVEGDEHQVHSQYTGIAQDVEPGARVLFADGTVELVVVKVDGPDVHCRVVGPGRLFSNKGLNLPGRKLSVQTLTEKDREDLAYIATADVDIVAISFVRSPADLALARELLGASKTPVMAKLERPEALECLDDILDASDGVMVARGDLGVELPFERVPLLQKQILERAAMRGKWAVVATQMLGSMTIARRPSRAEASDVVNAVLDGTDAVMLSEETAAGQNPVLAVEAMAVLTRAGESYEAKGPRKEVSADIVSFSAAAAGAAVSAAERLRARAIITLAGSGQTALAVSKWRPRLPIVALASLGSTLNRSNVLRGVVPLAIEARADFEEQLLVADRFLLAQGWAQVGDPVVVAAAIPLGEHKDANTVRFHSVRKA
jgi:pyruvate kinase